MARSPLVVALLAALVLAAPLTAAAEPPRFTASGSYLAGHAGTTRVDACGFADRATRDVDSSCVAIPSNLTGLPYDVTARDSTGVLVGVQTCFYADGRFLSCGTSTVPPGATFFSVSSLTGVSVTWTLTVE